MKIRRNLLVLISISIVLGITTFETGGAPRSSKKAGPRIGPIVEPVAEPTLWQVQKQLPAPVERQDPDAPVVNVAADANRTPPVQADLDPTIDVQITQEIIDKATELGTAERIYAFVRNEVEFQPYYGSRKGSVETLRQKAGNDYDQASLLIALLRASGIPARYAEGTIEMPVDQVSSWLGVDDGAVAGSILFTNGMEGISITAPGGGTDCCFNNGTPGCDDPDIEACVCAQDSFCCNTQWDQQCANEAVTFGCADCSPDVLSVRARRIWVEAYTQSGFGGPTWRPLDPSFALNEIKPGLDVPELMGLDAQTFISDYYNPVIPVPLPRAETPLELLQQQITDYLNANLPGTTLDDARRTQQVVSEELGLLPASLPYTVRTRDGSFAEIAASRRYQIRFHLYDGGTTLIDHTVNLPEVAGRRITISYEGATPADQATIDSFNGLLYTPPDMINLRPLLKVGGQTVATGMAAIGAGRTHNSDMHFLASVNGGGLPSNVVPSIFNTIIAGEEQAHGLSVNGVHNPLFAPEDPADTEGFESHLRFVTAMGYLERNFDADQELASLMDAKVTHDVANAIVQDQILVTTDGGGNPTAWEWRGLTVDADRSVLGAWKVDGLDSGCGNEATEILIIGGAHASLNESRIYEDDFGRQAVSTIQILQLAVDQGITVYERWNSLPLPANTQPAAVRSALESAILIGHEVTFPADPFTFFDWTGTGYIDIDPCTGAAGYIISGGQNGGSTVDAWVDRIWWTNPFKTVECIEGDVQTPDEDRPERAALYWDQDTTPMHFAYRLRVVYDDGTKGFWWNYTHTSKRPKDLAPGNYTLRVGDKSPPAAEADPPGAVLEHIRLLAIVKVEIVEVDGLRKNEVANWQKEPDPDKPGRLFIDTRETWNGTFLTAAHQDKQRVKLKVEVTPNMAPAGFKIRWEVRDPDDPATQTDVDPNGSGGDNTGNVHEGEAWWFTMADHPIGNRINRSAGDENTVIGEGKSDLTSVGGKLISTAFFHFTDDGGDNFKIKAVLMKDDMDLCDDDTATMTVWRKRFLIAKAMSKPNDDVQVHAPGTSPGAGVVIITPGPNTTTDTMLLGGDDTRMGQSVTAGPNGDAETTANSGGSRFYPSSAGTEADLRSALQTSYSRMGNAEDANHAAYLDWSVGTGATNLPFQASIIARTDASWAVYTDTNNHTAASKTHSDNRYYMFGTRYLVDLNGTARKMPEIGMSIGNMRTGAELTEAGAINRVVVHELGHAIVANGNNTHDGHTGGATQTTCAWEQSNKGAMGLEICEKHVRLLRNNSPRARPNHDNTKWTSDAETSRDSD